MADTVVFTNRAQSTLAGSISNVATSANLAPGTGALFPNPAADEYFVLTFQDAATGLLYEIVHVTGRSGDTITMQRAQEGTTGLAWSAGDLALLLFTAGTMAAAVQPPTLLIQAGIFGQDVGSVNAIEIDLGANTPASYDALEGAPIRVRMSATNTGATTMSFTGLSSQDVVNLDGTPMRANQLLEEGSYIFVLGVLGFYLQTTAVQRSGSQVLSGSGNFTVPAGVYLLDTVEMWAGGGSGGTSNSGSGPGSGGGGGEYVRLINYAVTPGQVISYAVGAGAAASTGSANGTAGGNTTWNSAAVTAHGGSGGTGIAAGTQVGGAGGTGASVPSGSIAMDGGGGDASGPTVGFVGGRGGASPNGGQGGNVSTGTAGAGKFPGGGGGGGGGSISSNGAAGAAGSILVTW